MNKDARTQAGTSRNSSSGSRSARHGLRESARARRTWYVLAGLLIGLAVTGALLKALAPPPLTPELFAVSQDQSVDRIFDTPVAVQPGRWHSIYVHHSLSSSGDAESIGQAFGDHFLIGNGNPLGDGIVQTSPRWSQQQSANVPGFSIDSDCLSICIVGDFNSSDPTPVQQARLIELISALQHRLSISPDNVWIGMANGDNSVAGIGSRFPISTIRSQLH